MSGALAIDSIGPTDAKVTPIITGRLDADARKTHALDQGRDAAGEQVGADQEGDVLRRHLERTAENEGDRDGAGIHDEDVLKPERQQLGCRKDLVHGMWVGAHGVLLEPWRRHGSHKKYASPFSGDSWMTCVARARSVSQTRRPTAIGGTIVHK